MIVRLVVRLLGVHRAMGIRSLAVAEMTHIDLCAS
jgi:hypothetical protein